MKKFLLGVVCLAAVAAAGFGGYTYYQNQTMDPWLKANIAALATIEDLAQGETDSWYAGYKTGSLTVNNITINCCVRGATTDACNYGTVSCITI